jgi:hypothetical protein
MFKKTAFLALCALVLSGSVKHSATLSGVYDSLAEHPFIDSNAERASLDFNDKKSIIWNPSPGCLFSKIQKKIGKKYVYKGRCGYYGAHGAGATLEVILIDTWAQIRVLIKSYDENGHDVAPAV